LVASRLQCVIALGGGALLNVKNQKTVLRSGTLVYLMLSEDGLFRRLTISETQTRPLLAESTPRSGSAEGNRNERRKTIAKLLMARVPGYEMAHVIVDMKDLTENESLEALLLALSGVGIGGI
jgi:shikimate kinase